MVSEAEEGGENSSGRNPALSVPWAALRFVTRLASGIFSRGKNLDQNSLDSKGDGEVQRPDMMEISEGRDCSSHESSSQKSNCVDCSEPCGAENGLGNRDDHLGTGASAETIHNSRIEEPDALECSKVETCNFKRFDIAKDPLDHYFLGANGQVISYC